MTKQKKTIAKTTHAGTKVRKQLAEASLAPKTKLGSWKECCGVPRARPSPRSPRRGLAVAQCTRRDLRFVEEEQGLTVVAEKAADGERVYRIAD